MKVIFAYLKDGGSLTSKMDGFENRGGSIGGIMGGAIGRSNFGPMGGAESRGGSTTAPNGGHEV